MSDHSTRDPDAEPRRGLRHRTAAVLPTLLTLSNLLSGFLSIFFASREQTIQPLLWGWTPLTFAALCVFLGMLFDGLDGRVARMTNQTSDLGEQLDSMADMVTFGVAPAFLCVQLARVGFPFVGMLEGQDLLIGRIVLALSGFYVARTALRLARFNVELESPEEEDHLSFKGLPSPGAAGTVAALVLLYEHFRFHEEEATSGLPISLTAVGVVVLLALTAGAMVSPLRYVHVLNRYFRERANFYTILVIVTLIVLLLIWPPVSLALVFTVYALSAPVAWLIQKMRRSPGDSSDATSHEQSI